MTEPADDSVLVERRDGVLTITLNRPEQRNAVTAAVRRQVRAAVDQLESDDELRVGILTGAGDKAFCAGMDLKEARQGFTSVLGGADGGFAGFTRLPRTKPVIAAVNGVAAGGGFELALACDLVVVRRSAWFALPEPSRGIIAGGGGAVRLPMRLPRVIANEVLLAGRRISATEALEWGLVNRVVEDDDSVTGAALDLAAQIVERAPLAVSGSLTVARASASMLEAPVWDVSDATVRVIRASADRREGSVAFAEKRPPQWTGA